MPLEVARDQLADALSAGGLKVVFAESCTAGLCSATLAHVEGISAHLCGSAVTYLPEIKQRWLGVRPETMKAHTCESLEVAEEMALGVLATTPEADCSAAVVGHLAEGLDCFVCVAAAVREKGTDGEPHVVHSVKQSLHEATRIARQREATQIVFDTLRQAIDRG